MLFAGKTAMNHAPYRAAIAIGIFFSLFAMSCAKDGLGTGGTGGAVAGTGGAITGTGGAIVGTGGAGGNRGSGGRSAATGGAMTTPDAGPQACVASGHTYAIGETFSVDCNTCTCTGGGIACTLMACFYDARPDQQIGRAH